MPDPTVVLDPRFSDPGSEPTPWSETAAVLAAAELSWLTTVRADGRPHVTPLVPVWLDDAAHFCTGPSEQKTANLRHGTDVALTTGRDDWDRGLDVVVEGRAARVTDDGPLLRLADAWRAKWDGQWQFQVRDGTFHHADGGAALVFRVTPATVLAFAKNPFSQTRYTF